MPTAAPALDPLQEVRELCAFEGRLAGTDAERRAANHLAQTLRGMGRVAEVEPIRVRPEYAVAHALHLLVAIVGSVLSVYVPAAGLALVLLAAVSMFGDLTTRFHLLRLLTPARASQNVVSPGSRPEAPARLVLTAHYDAARGGLVFAEPGLRRLAKLQQRVGRPAGPFQPLFWSLLAVLACTGLRLGGIESGALTAVQFAFTVVLLLALPLFVDIALSPAVPAASDNAAGVATVLRVAEALDRDPPENLDVWVLLPGAEEGFMLGMRAWMRRHGRALDRRNTIFLNVDTVGTGTVRYLRREGFVLLFDYHPELVALCDAIAAGDAGGERYGARPLDSRFGTDGLVARLAGCPAITIGTAGELDHSPNYHQTTDTPERLDPAALERAYAFVLELARRADAQVGRPSQ